MKALHTRLTRLEAWHPALRPIVVVWPGEPLPTCPADVQILRVVYVDTLPPDWPIDPGGTHERQPA